MAVAVLFTASCAKEDISSSIAGGEVEVTFTASLPELGTRAFGEGENADILFYNIYEAGTENILTDLCGSVESDTGVFNVHIVLLKGMQYDLVFWAQNKDCGYYTLDGKKVTAVYEGKNANDDVRDAFYNFIPNFNPANPETTSFALHRPFAQLNAAVKNSDIEAVEASDVVLTTSTVEVDTYTGFNIATGDVTGNKSTVTFVATAVPSAETFKTDYTLLSMNYLLVPKTGMVSNAAFSFNAKKPSGDAFTFTGTSYNDVPLKQNYRTNILGELLTKPTEIEVTIDAEFGGETGEIDGQTFIKVKTIEEFNEAFADNKYDLIILEDNIVLNSVVTRASDPLYTVAKGKELTIDLNGKKLSSTSTQIGTNYNMFDVHGTLTVKNGTLETKHEGENMNWNNSTNIFNVTNGGVLNLEDITAKNLGGSDMAFVAHLNNWGEVTLNVENSTLESTYVPVRVFNSGNDMNNVTIKNSTLKGVSAAFWVHNYTAADFGGSEEKAEAHKALLNLNIYNQGNTFSPDVNGIRYGFTNSVRADAYGITKSVSEDGTEVTLGSIVEDGLIRRGVAGDEGNNTIKKVVVDEGVTTLYDRTFRRFYALETVELPSTLTTIGVAGTGVFQSCTALKNIVIPESVTVLGKGTFQECSSLESINIPAGVTRIEDNTFNASGLESIEFHAGVTYFGARAFRDCKQLKEVVINAPEFTIVANAFGVMAGTLPGTVIYVANAEMKAYLESTLSYISQFEIVAPNTVSSADDLIEALENGKDVIFEDDVKIEPANMSNAYGATGINVKNGQTIDGNGHILDIKGAGGTWDSGISTTGGVIKNITVTGSFRGIFINHNSDYSGKVILENVTTTGTVYTISCDQGTNNGLEATNCSFYGWTSYAATLGDAKFVNCTFGEGSGYAYCRPYAPTEFVGCKFEAGFTVDPIANISFENCTLDGVALTTENISTLVTDASKVTVK